MSTDYDLSFEVGFYVSYKTLTDLFRRPKRHKKSKTKTRCPTCKQLVLQDEAEDNDEIEYVYKKERFSIGEFDEFIEFLASEAGCHSKPCFEMDQWLGAVFYVPLKHFEPGEVDYHMQMSGDIRLNELNRAIRLLPQLQERLQKMGVPVELKNGGIIGSWQIY